MSTHSYTVRRLGPEDTEQLTDIFNIISNDATARLFHPHSFTAEYANIIANYNGKDVYFGMFDGCEIIGYGMLRGWDEGHKIPSLGIYLVPKCRGMRLAKSFMFEINQVAIARGAKQIRLSVYKNNIIARKLYESMGYELDVLEDNKLVGLLSLYRKKES
jgi:ribosomal protein S18 acetylase RimI-like enzyme